MLISEIELLTLRFKSIQSTNNEGNQSIKGCAN